jgi:UDP-2,4-diacetamido-2,4,6-trideoxy-beta-L-altropyranose hydrolase
VKVAIRTDASLDIGTGHVMRCLTLANRLAARGARVVFICRKDAGHLCDQIEDAGFSVTGLASASKLPDGAGWQRDAEESLEALNRLELAPDLLVVDQYLLDERWERAMRSRARRILVIDDLANRAHECDMLLDPNLHDAPDSRYTGLVSERTRVFVGPKYALLRPEFERFAPRTRDKGVDCLMIFFGGADPTNEALKLVQALRALGAQAPRSVMVLGPINPRSEQIRRAALGLSGLELVGATREMARLMAESDLALGTCGGAAWERCFLGLPALVVVSAENQRDDARILHCLGAVRNLGEAAETSVGSWAAAIAAMQDDPVALTEMSRAAQAVMRGRQEAVRDFESALVH